MGIFSEAVRLVLTQKLLKHHKFNIVESQATPARSPRYMPPVSTRDRTQHTPTLVQYFLAPIGAGFLLAGAAVHELPHALEVGAWATVQENAWTFFASASLGVAASFMTFLVIKKTNSVTLKVLNTARNAAFVLFTVTFMQEAASALQLCGYTLSLAAFSVYSWLKTHAS